MITTSTSHNYNPLIFEPLKGKEQAPLTPIQKEILELKEQNNAVILAHSYQIEPIQRIADYLGDSLGLSYKAAETEADTIVFCGVHFMAETAKIINPGKRVLLPDINAGCSLSDSCSAEKLATYKQANPNLYVIAYINCSAAVKTLSDVICTSSNAVEIVNRIPEDKEILFVPDQNLGQWVSEKTSRPMHLWPGSCYAHALFTVRSIEKIKIRFPDAPIVAHPECITSVRDMADEVCSTEKMIAFCKKQSSENIIVATESGMLNRLRSELPDKRFIAAPTENCACNDCRFMKMNTIEKVRNCLRDKTPQIELPQSTIEKAYAPIKRMLDWSR